MNFAARMTSFGERAQMKQDQALRKCALELFSRVIMRTPVDTGRLRGNWMATQNAPASTSRDLKDNASPVRESGQGSSIAKSEMYNVVLGADAPSVFYLTNTLPYAGVVEYGSSRQSPKGMVRVSVAEYEDIVSEVTSAL